MPAYTTDGVGGIPRLMTSVCKRLSQAEENTYEEHRYGSECIRHLPQTIQLNRPLR